MSDESVKESISIVIPEGRLASPPREPLLSQLDLTQRFIAEIEIIESDFEASCTSIIPINTTSERPLAFQAINIIPTTEDASEITTIFLFDNSNKDVPTLAGYATFSLDRTEGKATIDINFAKIRKYAEAIDRLPTHIQQILRETELRKAFKITAPELLKEGHGKNLWLLSSAILELQGIQQITISGDETIDQVAPAESFYGKMGATPNGDGTQNYQIGENLDHNRATIHNLLAQ